MIDWGDALESRTSAATSVVRVEAMPFFNYSSAELTGFDMWHVSGTGIDEMWGSRATDDANPLPFKYDTQYAIMHTGSATLHLAKLSTGAVTCPATPSVDGSSPYDDEGEQKAILTWDASTQRWVSDPGLPFQTYMPYNPEMNIQGKFVYGYNWKLKTFDTNGVDKAGWWRLSFYSPDLAFGVGTIVGIPLVPPAVSAAIGVLAVEPAEETEGRLYVPKILPDYNLTFIDVCLSAAKGGGGNSRKPPSPGE
jgi:hypothetical protein